MRFLCIFLLIVTILGGACQEENTHTVSARTKPQTGPTDPFLQELTGRILFQSDRDGDWEIYIMNVDGSNLVQLTHNQADDEYPVWSPDGAQIAFKSNRDGNFEIYVMNADGTHEQRLTNHSANDEDPAWSPDGKQIAFHSDRKSGIEIYTINADRSGLTRFTKTIGKNALPAWSPDGKHMAYTGNRYLGWNVYVTDLDKTSDNRITDGHGACRPDWSPEGNAIAYVSQKADGKGDIWTMKPDGAEKTQLTFDDVNYDYYPAWSPDGKYLTYAKTSHKETGNWELYIMTSDGQQHVRLTNHPARDKFPDWSRGRVSDEIFKRQQFVYEAESSPRQIGKQTEDAEASGAQAVYAQPSDGPGYLVYGPYQSYEPSEYVASFRLKTDQTDRKKPVALIDVVTDAGSTVLVKKELRGRDFQRKNAHQEFQLPFSLQEIRKLEFRVYVSGNAQIWSDNVTVMIDD